MRNNIPETFQNLDVPQVNPLKKDDLDSTDITPKNGKKFDLPKDPKILLLIVLGAVIVVLLILSIFVSAARSTKKPTTTPKTTPVPTSSIPTPNPEVIVIPTQYQAQIKDLDTAIKENVDFPIPQIDPSIGLTTN